MRKTYDVHYNDGAYYGTISFDEMTQPEIEVLIQTEIDSNNKNPNPLYHITRDNFKESKPAIENDDETSNQINNQRYGFIFEFKDGGWNIIMFDEEGEYHKCYGSDEDSYDNSIMHLNDYVVDSSNIRRYEIPTYDEFCEVVDDDLIFKLSNEGVKGFESYIR